MNRRFRHIAILALAAVMTVGCGSASEEDIDLPVPPQPGQETPIAFSGSLSDEGEVTRTDPAAPAGLETVLPEGSQKFKVWAYKNVASSYQTVMDGYTVNWVENTAYTPTSNTHDWEYVNQQPANGTEQTIKYWDWSATAYRFFGYTGSEAFSGPDVNDKMSITFNADVSTDDGIAAIPYYSRLWYSTPADDSFGKAVILEFLKPIARVRFMFTYESQEDAMMSVLSEMSFKPSDDDLIEREGQVTISYPLKGTATNEVLEIEEIPTESSKNISALTEDNRYYSVLPAVNQGTYTLSVSVNGIPKTAEVPAEFMNWLPGYEYTYIFKVHVDGGVEIDMVQSAFTPWIEHTGTHTVYNW